MGKGESEDWDEKHQDTRQTQPQKHGESESKSSESSCPKCCLRTRDCLMSPECGRALQISSVVAWCGMCIRMFVCDPQQRSVDGVEGEPNLLRREQTHIEVNQDFKLFLLDSDSL